ncbi:MAG TPA: 4-alpha-glucanotransferase [Sedimentibacter sp.]|nr:4-alpha-glucanotransferase [Sedimentibacter sp.]
MFKRSAGILLPVFSLPSEYGIGTLGKEACNFIDFLKDAGQKYWQLLPLGHTSCGDSPYSCFSVFAGNPCFIDPKILALEGFIEEADLRTSDFESNDDYVDYQKLFEARYKILRKAYINKGKSVDLTSFRKDNPWVLDYALFMTLKYKNNQIPWYEWDEGFIKRDERILQEFMKENEEYINFWIFLQYLFFKQYYKLKKYAESSGISIIGDIPVYVAFDSVDVWVHKGLFMLDEENLPLYVAGVPPDYFSGQGQLWGNPVYDWNHLKETGYEWWLARIEFSFKMYDALRIDHFRGFDEFWAVPYGSENAVKGAWMPAHGRDLFQKIKERAGKVNIIAEDLGIITDSIIKLKNDLGYPGMKVLQFAFDGNPYNPYLPQNYEKNCVAYTGTHDNDTLKGWFEKLDAGGREYVLRTLNIKVDDIDEIVYESIMALYKSKADLCIIPLQDFLCLGSEARINTPSTLGFNWRWRLKRSMLTKELAEKIRNMALTAKRC